MWTPIVAKAFNLVELKEYVQSLDFSQWKPSLIVWHNTALPTIAQWENSVQEDIKNHLVPGITRIRNLETYFKGMGWSAGPHFFVYKDVVWAFTPANKKGVHSPSWNGVSIGIEMIADFDIEDDETGSGLLIKNNTIALTAMLCEKLGLNPEIGEVTSKSPLKITGSIFIHKQDPKTQHDCPGKHIAVDHADMVAAVQEYLGHGGEHIGTVDLQVPKPRTGQVIVSSNDTLNLREESTASSTIIKKLSAGTQIIILNEAMNGSTKWFYIGWATYKGWVSAKYIKEN